MADSFLLTQLEDLNLMEFFQFLGDYGWIQILFPFLLVYSLVFTITSKVSIIEDKKGVRMLVALIVGFFSVTFPIGNTTSCDSPLQDAGFSFDSPMFGNGCTLGDYMALLFPGVSVFSLMVLGIYIVVSMLGFDLSSIFTKGEHNALVVAGISLIGVLIIGTYTLQTFGLIEDDGEDNEIIQLLKDPLLWILVIFFLLFKFISSDDDNSNGKKKKNQISITTTDSGNNQIQTEEKEEK